MFRRPTQPTSIPIRNNIPNPDLLQPGGPSRHQVTFREPSPDLQPRRREDDEESEFMVGAMSGLGTPQHEDQQWIVPPSTASQVEMATGPSAEPVVDGVAGFEGLIIQNAKLVFADTFKAQAAQHTMRSGRTPNFQSLGQNDFFHVTVYLVPKVKQPNGLQGTAWRAILYWLETTQHGINRRILAHSDRHHGHSVKAALSGLLEATARLVWGQQFLEFKALESGGLGFLADRKLSVS